MVPQVMSLCLKSGNATIFKGGSEAKESNRTIFQILVKACMLPMLPVYLMYLAAETEHGKRASIINTMGCLRIHRCLHGSRSHGDRDRLLRWNQAQDASPESQRRGHSGLWTALSRLP